MTTNELSPKDAAAVRCWNELNHLPQQSYTSARITQIKQWLKQAGWRWSKSMGAWTLQPILPGMPDIVTEAKDA